MEQIEFLATDGIILEGILYKSKEKTNKVILAVHGMSSNCMKKRDRVISRKANENNIDYFCFNNRGSELVKYTKRNINGKKEKFIMGTSFEDVTEGYEDIVGAMIKLKELGYEEIYLQGHSLGCTKIVYSYNELKEEQDELIKMVKGVILLSLVDIPQTLKFYLRENFNKYLEYAEEQEKQDNKDKLMPKEAFIHPISVKTFLRYARDNKEIDLAGYGRDTKLQKLNNIDVPLFMRWGNDNEMILQRTEELVDMVNNILKNENKDIDYIDGANHGYENKEEELAEQIIKFIK